MSGWKSTYLDARTGERSGGLTSPAPSFLRPSAPALSVPGLLRRGGRLERRLDGGLERLVGALGHPHAVDEERRGGVDAEPLAVEDVALDLVLELPAVERRVELRAVEAERGRVLLELLGSERGLVAVEDGDVVPELALLARGLG